MTTAYHGTPVPISGTGSSDTNGLASFRHLRAYRPALIGLPDCPLCDRPMHYNDDAVAECARHGEWEEE